MNVAEEYRHLRAALVHVVLARKLVRVHAKATQFWMIQQVHVPVKVGGHAG